jgi:hypothetical protein
VGSFFPLPQCYPVFLGVVASPLWLSGSFLHSAFFILL